jgi:hypothetical protein
MLFSWFDAVENLLFHNGENVEKTRLSKVTKIRFFLIFSDKMPAKKRNRRCKKAAEIHTGFPAGTLALFALSFNKVNFQKMTFSSLQNPRNRV